MLIVKRNYMCCQAGLKGRFLSIQITSVLLCGLGLSKGLKGASPLLNSPPYPESVFMLISEIVSKGIDKLFRIWYKYSMKIWSVREAAIGLGISERRVRKLLAEGRIKGKKLDGTWVVLKLSYERKGPGRKGSK